MAFVAAFIAHAPDADSEKHRCVIDTGMYRLVVVVVKDQEQALAVSRELVEKEGIHSVLLCPGFTHADVAGIAEAVGESVGVTVARGDGPSNRIAVQTIAREWGGR
mgnify:CR=1 FL=1